MSQAQPSQRLATLRITAELLLTMLRCGVPSPVVITKNPLPADVRLVQAHYDQFSDMLILTLQSETFAAVNWANTPAVPVLEPPQLTAAKIGQAPSPSRN